MKFEVIQETKYDDKTLELWLSSHATEELIYIHARRKGTAWTESSQVIAAIGKKGIVVYRLGALGIAKDEEGRMKVIT